MNRKPKPNRLWVALTTLLLILGLLAYLRRHATRPDAGSVAAPNDVRHTKDSATQQASRTIRPASLPFAQYDKFPPGYIGTAACAACHADRHQSYLSTHHSRSLREIDVSTEPQDQELVHQPSQRSYDIIADEGRLWHREWRHWSDAAEDRLETGRLPVCYVMGSGAFAKGYLLGDGDYLLQSPVTWYVGSQSIGMAPGYEGKHHLGLTRMIHDECLFCHAGLVSRRNNNPHHPAIHELAIGCERCHGPGAEHATLYRSIAAGDVSAAVDLDTKIVDPKDLSRTQAESICGQCHLHGEVSADAAGAELWDFRPGDDFAGTRVHYKSGSASDFKKAFTGHFDQMWQSRCYTMSDTLTCVTCHDPHPDPSVSDSFPDDLAAYRREQCNRCHQDQGCALPLDQRMTQHRNDCIACHMPKIGSEVPHTSTTSHWIAVYQAGKPRQVAAASDTPAADSSAPGPLRRIPSAPNLSQQELARRDLLGRSFWIENEAKQGNLEPLLNFSQRVELESLCRGDRSDAEIHSLLARMARMVADAIPETAENQSVIDRQWQFAAGKAKQTLSLEPRPVKTRAAALEVLGNHLMRRGDYANALDCFGELVQIRRAAKDWYHLGICLARGGRLADAEKALREAIRVDANYDAPYRSLSVLYRAIDPGAAQEFAIMAQRLQP